MSQHGDKPEDVVPSSYRRFLVDSPLQLQPPVPGSDDPLTGYGSFHQRYYLDGERFQGTCCWLEPAVSSLRVPCCSPLSQGAMVLLQAMAPSTSTFT